MFFSLSKMISLAVFATAVAAIPAGENVEWNGGGATTVTVTAPSPTTTVTQSSCSTGDQKCCNTVTNSSAAGVSSILGLLGIVLDGLNVPIGLDCLPILGGACQAQAVCCTDNSHGNAVSLGCIPLQL
ncbi:hydrophobin 1 [Lentinula aff. detonsa]|uniref:Hydrophobin n=1 Tax=Lentinula aff. detonsa TaxID=2804958 RepID=A0AA38K9L6_9AGAR|nr:hydrophobin 1 [Lentinula aff. detonsa]